MVLRIRCDRNSNGVSFGMTERYRDLQGYYKPSSKKATITIIDLSLTACTQRASGGNFSI